MTIFDDLTAAEDDGRPVNTRSKKARRSLGKLHDLLTEKLPDFKDPQSGVCNLHRVAKARGMTFQGVYKWFKDKDANRVPYAQALWLVETSKVQKSGGAKFEPLTLEEIQPYITVV